MRGRELRGARKRGQGLSAAVVALLLLLAACGELPTAPPLQESPPPALQQSPTAVPTEVAYPPPPTPESTATPTATPTPTPLPVPVLEVRPVPAELHQGERIALLRDGDLWLVRPDGSGETQVSTSANVSAIFGWSWDNSLLLLGVTSYETGGQCGYPGAVDLWVLPSDGSTPQQITKGQSVYFASWSPVDFSIAYFTYEFQVYAVDLEKTETRQLEGRRGWFQDSAWSPDGTRLALILPPADWLPGAFADSTDIAVWNLQDGKVTDLTSMSDDPSNITNYFPIWSMDGSSILFHSERDVFQDQFWYVTNSDGSSLQHLDTVPLLVPLNVIRSPVADQVVMNVGGEVWLLDFDGNMKKIADTPWPCWAPYAWSPDGARLALVEKEGKLVQVGLGSLAVETIVEAGSSPAWTH